MKICICSSMAFYKEFMLVKTELEKLGHKVVAPELEFETEGDDTSVGAYFDNNGGIDAFPFGHEVWKRKRKAILSHFQKIADSDGILVTNYEKKGQKNYIGANTFLEMGYAFGLGKKVFVLNDLPQTSPYREEMYGINPILLSGDLRKIV